MIFERRTELDISQLDIDLHQRCRDGLFDSGREVDGCLNHKLIGIHVSTETSLRFRRSRIDIDKDTVMIVRAFAIRNSQTVELKVTGADTLTKIHSELDFVQKDSNINRERWRGSGDFVELLHRNRI